MMAMPGGWVHRRIEYGRRFAWARPYRSDTQQGPTPRK
ncbi:hypothetical protein ACNKHU_20950 [Shigella flexneri]